MNSVQLALHVKSAQQILRALDCPRALTVSIMLDSGDYEAILNLKPCFEFLNAEDFFRHYQATKLLAKAKWLPSGIDKKAAAIKVFLEAEASCSVTNQVFREVRSGSASWLNPGAEALILKVRRKISQVLGTPNYHWVGGCGFGPGADRSTVGGFTAAYDKLQSPGTVTHGCKPYLRAFVENSYLNRKFQYDLATRDLLVETTSGNRVTFVPKNSKTDRSIAVEPRWNIFFQKGFGDYLRRRLLRFGVDLNSQVPNQEAAGVGSRNGSTATIDLKSASDTVSREIIWDLFPVDWAIMLDHLRSPTGSLEKGKPFRYEKWSSMGNGYTFELESLLFFAICSAFTDDVSVYGDDLIVPTEHYPVIVDALSFFGFQINTEKSFCSGPFRESCGSDYFNGVLCTPIYWKDQLNDKGTLRLVNQISSLATRLGNGFTRHRGLRRVHTDLVNRLPKHFQSRGPRSISTCVHDSFETWNARKRWGWCGWFVVFTIETAKQFRFRDFDSALGHVLLNPSSDGYSVRDRTQLKKLEVFIPSGFEDFGPWV
jgi:hypothetical protein